MMGLRKVQELQSPEPLAGFMVVLRKIQELQGPGSLAGSMGSERGPGTRGSGTIHRSFRVCTRVRVPMSPDCQFTL